MNGVSPDLASLIQTAFVLEWVTLAWVVMEAGIGLWSGWNAHSLTLIAFGADSLIEALSACVLIWRLSVELQQGRAFPESTEQ